MAKTQKRAAEITTKDSTFPSAYTLNGRRVTSVRRIQIATNTHRIEITHQNARGDRYTNTYAPDALITVAA